jgi:tRNA(fMet)-specific endonuclease VapC
VKVLDSDHWIALLRRRLDLRGRVVADEELAITAISVGELVHGACKSARVGENLARLDVLLAAVTILPYDEGAARRFGLLKADLEQAGTSLSELDLQIASIALHYDAPLVTHNRGHFERVPGLVIEDWLLGE